MSIFIKNVWDDAIQWFCDIALDKAKIYAPIGFLLGFTSIHQLGKASFSDLMNAFISFKAIVALITLYFLCNLICSIVELFSRKYLCINIDIFIGYNKKIINEIKELFAIVFSVIFGIIIFVLYCDPRNYGGSYRILGIFLEIIFLSLYGFSLLKLMHIEMLKNLSWISIVFYVLIISAFLILIINNYV